MQVGCFQALDVAACMAALGTQEAPKLPVFCGTTVRKEGRSGEGNAGLGFKGICLLGSESQLIPGVADAPVFVGEPDSNWSPCSIFSAPLVVGSSPSVQRDVLSVTLNRRRDRQSRC